MALSWITRSAADDSMVAPPPWFIDPSAIMQIQNLTLRAKAVVEGFANGLHRSPLRGFSVEFAEYRPYCVGDDPRNLDWKLLARTDRYYVKQFEDETNRRCYLAVDQSRSMNYGSLEYTKAQYARTLAATLSYFLYGQRDAVGIMTCGTNNAEYLPARHRPGHLQQVMNLLSREYHGDRDLSEALEQLAGLSKRRGLVVLISDLLVPVESLAQPLGYLRGRGHELMILRVLDPTELELTLTDSVLLRDMETGRQLNVDPDSSRVSYIERFQAHRRELVELCHRQAIRLAELRTDSPLDHALFELLHAMARG